MSMRRQCARLGTSVRNVLGARSREETCRAGSAVVQALESRLLMSFTPLNSTPSLSRGPAVSAADSSGNIYVATSYDNTDGGASFAISRFTASGSLDTTWGSGGTLELSEWGTYNSETSQDVPEAIAIQDGNIVVVGSSSAFGMVAAKVDNGYNSSTLSYGNVDWQTQQTVQQAGAATAVLIDENGNIFVAGNDGGSDMVVAKLENSSGLLNTGFNSLGTKPGTLKISVSGSTSVAATSIVSNDSDTNYPDSNVYIGGYTEYSAGGGTASDFTVAAVTRSGSMVSGFGTSGIARTNFASCNPNACVAYSNDAAYSLAEWDNGSGGLYLYAAGVTNADGNNQAAVARYSRPGGTLDDTWGFVNGGGTHTGRLIGRAGGATGIVLPGGLMGNGRFVLDGIDSNDFFLHSYNSDGSDYDGFSSGTADEQTGTFGGSDVTSVDSLNVTPSGDIEISGVNPTACGHDIGLAEYSFS